MRRLTASLLVPVFALTLAGAPAFAQDHHDDDRHHDQGHDRDHRDDRDRGDHHYVRHDDWKRGQRMRHEDWDRGRRVDYRAYRLRRPPRGYEWREVDGNYVLAAVATGIIASVIAAQAAR